MKLVLVGWLAFLMAGSALAADAVVAQPGDGPVLLFPIVKDGKWGYMDKKGKVVIEPQYQVARDFHEGLACVAVKALRGYIDRTGQMVIKPQFGWAGDFSEGLAFVNLHKDMYGEHVEWYKATTGTGFIDKSGKVYKWNTDRNDFKEGLVWTSGRPGAYLDKEGKRVASEAEEGSTFSEGMAAARKGDKWGYLSRETMKFAIPPQWTAARAFSNGMAAVAEGTFSGREPNLKWGYVDKSGKLVIAIQFADAGLFFEEVAPVKIGSKWGYVDKAGKMVVEAKYDYAWRFSEGLGRVLVGEKHGYIDKAGSVVVEPKYDAAWEFNKGLARVGIGDKEGYIDRSGKYVWEPTE